jgi:hypothetical protein
MYREDGMAETAMQAGCRGLIMLTAPPTQRCLEVPAIIKPLQPPPSFLG